MQQVCAALGVPPSVLEAPPSAAEVLHRMCINLVKVTMAAVPTRPSCRGWLASRGPYEWQHAAAW
jgi:hypothetical protein